MVKKYTYEDVNKKFKSKDLTLISDKYINVYGLLLFRCNKHPDIVQQTKFVNILKDNTCPCSRCLFDLNSKVHRNDFNKVLRIFDEHNLVPYFKEEDYKNRFSRLKFKCAKHEHLGVMETCLANVQSLKLSPCPDCVKDKLKENKISKTDKMKNIFEKNNMTPIFNIYENSRTDVEFICNSHPELGVQKIKTEMLKRRGWKPYCCKEYEKILEKKSNSRSTRAWSEYTKEEYKNKCCKCESKENLHIHHIFNYKSYPELSTMNGNGVLLCEKCHKIFHKLYGSKNNTPSQLFEFMRVNKICKCCNFELKNISDNFCSICRSKSFDFQINS